MQFGDSSELHAYDFSKLKGKFSTSSPDNGESFCVFNKKYKLPHNLSKWETQLQKIKECDSSFRSINLEFVDYAYDKQIGSADELEIVKEDITKQMLAKAKCRGGFSPFQKAEDIQHFLNLLLPTSEAHLSVLPMPSENKEEPTYYFEENDLGTVKIKWKYQGRSCMTICLVSAKKGIVYDEFLYFIAVSCNAGIPTDTLE